MKTLTERVAAVLRQIDEQLALDQKATKGPWLATQARGPASTGQFEIQNYDGVRYNLLAVLTPFGEDSNATFIAASRTGWPASLRVLKTAITGLRALRNTWAEAAEWLQVPVGVGPRNLQDCVADLDDQLTDLCDQWEETQKGAA